MRDAGANAIWIGQNNPGEVDAHKVEPGLSYAVYAAVQDANDPFHADAVAMSDAVTRALTAARDAGLQVILPIGYQIQMGSAWDRKYPDELRRTYDGNVLQIYNSGATASPYSAQYRSDITRYYQWIQNEYVSPFKDTIVMLSLADEPMGGDYSDAAKQEFARRYGKPMEALAADEQWKIGEFESGVVADYAAWSSDAWKQINPGLPTTMSFHGGDTARRVWGLPDTEKLFSETPDNFVVSFDAYFHDDFPSKPATDAEAAQLKLFLTTIGHYSKAYNKSIALWGSANAWGLAQESSNPLGIPDSVTNLALLNDLPTEAGGRVWGVIAWNYNVKQQGLYNYSHATTYDPHNIEIAVDRVFPILRSRAAVNPAGSPDIALLTSSRVMYNALATSHAADIPPEWFDSTAYARAFFSRNAAFVTTSESLKDLREANYFVVTAPASALDAPILEFLKARFTEGRIILANDVSIAHVWNVRSETWNAGLSELPVSGGLIYVFKLENPS